MEEAESQTDQPPCQASPNNAATTSMSVQVKAFEATHHHKEEASTMGVPTASTSPIQMEDLSHPWPHLETFFGPVVAKKKVIERGQTVYKGSITCKNCKANIAFSTYSLFSLKSHYKNVHPNLLTDLVSAISAGSKRGRSISPNTDMDFRNKRLQQAIIKSMLTFAGTPFNSNETQELFCSPSTTSPSTPTSMDRQASQAEETHNHKGETAMPTEDLSHPWPHLEAFFGPVITKKKVIEKGKAIYKGIIACKNCKGNLAFNTYSLFSLKKHYKRVHPELLKDVMATISAGSKRGRRSSSSTGEMESKAKKWGQPSMESMFAGASFPYLNNMAQELFYSSSTASPATPTSMDRQVAPAEVTHHRERKMAMPMEDLSHPWPHLDNFFGPVIAKNKVIEKGKAIYRGTISCRMCKANLTFNTYSLFCLKNHYRNVHPHLLKDVITAISAGSKRGRPISSSTRGTESKGKKLGQASIESTFDGDFAASLYNKTQELFYRCEEEEQYQSQDKRLANDMEEVVPEVLSDSTVPVKDEYVNTNGEYLTFGSNPCVWIKEEPCIKEEPFEETSFKEEPLDERDMDLNDVLMMFETNCEKENSDGLPEDDSPVEEPAAAVGEAEGAQTEGQESLKNPWPHLEEEYFVFKSRDKANANLLYFRCLMCHPKETIIKAQVASLYNLKSHVKRKHSAHAIQFEERIKAGSLRGKNKQSHLPGSDSRSQSMLQTPAEKRHQSTIGEVFGHSTTGINVCQSVVDTKIVDLFICNMLPLHVVESPTFVSLIRTLNPSKTSMSRHTLGRRVLASHKQLEGYLIRLLRDVPWVATTVDCWSAHNRSYLGMTAHWLHPKTRTREHAILACKQLIGHRTCDVLANAIMDTHYKFYLQDKVTRITTDNGSNFVKAFMQFGTEAELSLDIPADPDMEGIEDVDLNEDPKAEDVDEVEYISVDAAIDESSDLGISLPVHMKCAAHTFNLIASVDAGTALDTASFKSAYRKAMSKAQALWNLQNRSTEAADSILHELERRLVVPNSTRWNSTYDSVVVLNNLLQKKREAIHRVMIQLKLETFTDSEVFFLMEYTWVMSIVAKALDKIQGKDQAYLGSLLPTVAATVMKLKEVKSKDLSYCSPLVDALLAGITKRFGLLLKDQECQLAAAFHPKFRLLWLEQYDSSQLIRVKEAMETAVETALMETSDWEEASSNPSNNEGEEDDFFSCITQSRESRNHRSPKFKAQNLVKTWLEAGSKEDLTEVAFLGEQVLIDLFTKYNTPIPSSAAVECLFSTGKDILWAKRATLSDGNFERLMLMKGNQHHIKAMEKVQSE